MEPEQGADARSRLGLGEREDWPGPALAPFRRYRVGQWGGWPKSIRTNLADSWAWSSPKGGLRPKPCSYAELTRSGERLCHPRAGLVPERGKGAEFDSASAFYVQ